MLRYQDRPLHEFYEAIYLVETELAHLSQIKDNGHIRRWREIIGDIPIGEIRRATLKQFRLGLEAMNLGPDTVHAHLSTVRAVIFDTEREIDFRGIMPRLRYAAVEPPTAEEIDRLYAVADFARWPATPENNRFNRHPCWCKSPPDWWRALLCLGVTTGMRRGDTYGLAWANLDHTRRVIRWRAHKTGKRQEVPLLPVLVEHLEPLRANNTERIFGISDRCNRQDREFSRLCDLAGIRRITLQNIRQTAGTVFERARPLAGQLLLGHDVARWMAFRRYIPALPILESAVPLLKLPGCLSSKNEAEQK